MQHLRFRRRARALLAATPLLSLFAAFTAFSCDDGALPCVPGQSAACTCTSGLSGAQVCRADGSGFESCICDGSGGAGSGTTTSTTTTSTATTHPTTTSGTGGAAPCTPGTASACYEGPAGTEGKGICKGGMHTCLADMTFDACVGQVLPGSEDCNTPEDEDCDGATPACPNAWTVVLGDDTMTQVGLTLFGLAPNGDVVVTASFSGDITLGGVTHHASQFSDVFVARFTSNGDFVWFRQLPGLAEQNPSAIAVGPAGEIVVVGETRGALDFGAGMQQVSGMGDGFLWKLNPDGTSAWGTLVGSNEPNSLEVIRSVAIDSSGNIGFSGYVFGFAAIGTLELSGGGGKYYYALVQPNGTPTWAFEYSGSPPSAAAFDAANNFYVSGGGGIIDFGAGALPANVYAARFSPTGAVQASKVYWDNNQIGLPSFGSFAPQTNGHTVRVIALSNTTPFDFGGGPAGAFYYALVGLDVQMQHEFTRGFMSFGATSSFSAIIGPRPTKGTVIAGTISGSATIDTSAGPIMSSTPDASAYFARVSPTGVITDGTIYPMGAQCSFIPYAVAADANDRIYVSGTYNGQTCGGLGTGQLPPALVRGFISRLAW